jgi:hypothetical protein
MLRDIVEQLQTLCFEIARTNSCFHHNTSMVTTYGLIIAHQKNSHPAEKNEKGPGSDF